MKYLYEKVQYQGLVYECICHIRTLECKHYYWSTEHLKKNYTEKLDRKDREKDFKERCEKLWGRGVIQVEEWPERRNVYIRQ